MPTAPRWKRVPCFGARVGRAIRAIRLGEVFQSLDGGRSRGPLGTPGTPGARSRPPRALPDWAETPAVDGAGAVRFSERARRAGRGGWPGGHPRHGKTMAEFAGPASSGGWRW